MQPLNIMHQGAPATPPPPPPPDPLTIRRETRRLLALAAAALVGWWLLYRQLPALADLLAFRLLGLTPQSPLGEAVRFFVYDTPKVLMLLSLVVFGVGVLRSFF
ncbi:MAG TPA: hypothetical protein VLL73_08445, partial [Desulfurivibrionaceae bacterium]|nr:hypothetical protein [Desulfurivibrionaceae bacterium]